MGKGQPPTSRKGRERAEKRHIPHSTAAKKAHTEELHGIFENVFESAPDGKILCDQEGKIRGINASALKLFELSSERPCLGMPCQQFLQPYERPGEQPATSPEPWLLGFILGEDATSGSCEEIMPLQLPSGRRVYVDMRCSPVCDTRKREIGTLVILRDITHLYQKAQRLQHVHEALLTLVETIARFPTGRDLSGSQTNSRSPEDTFLLSPPMLFIAQQFVNLVRDVLNGQKVCLLANIPPTGRTYYVAGSGFTAEQEQHRREIRGRFLPSDFLDPTALARLSAGQEVVLAADLLHIPPGYQPAFDDNTLLIVPLMLQERLVGFFLIAKDQQDNAYSAEEIAFVQAVAAQSLLILECLHCWCEQQTNHCSELVQQEMNHLISDFLNLASHELKTPLTVIKGNIQLAQRRVAKLRQQVEELSERAGENVEHIQQALVSASQSARLQERMINDLIDDARIQTNRLELSITRCDLITLLRTVVAEQQSLVPEHTITLEIIPAREEAPILADAERIKQVITTYVANALKYSPAERPVTVRLTIAESIARVSVRDEGPGIPAEEQQHLWDRFYRGKGTSIQHELDLSLGLGLYLCKVFIELHYGSVGMQSDTRIGVIFWFTLPLAEPADA